MFYESIIIKNISGERNLEEKNVGISARKIIERSL